MPVTIQSVESGREILLNATVVFSFTKVGSPGQRMQWSLFARHPTVRCRAAGPSPAWLARLSIVRSSTRPQQDAAAGAHVMEGVMLPHRDAGGRLTEARVLRRDTLGRRAGRGHPEP